MRVLYDWLSRRKRPEDVADRVLGVLEEELSKRERSLLERAARGALRRKVKAYTSMLEDFARPIGLGRQVARAQVIFETAYALDAEACSDPVKVEAFLRHIGAEIHKGFGRNDFLYDRMNREVRKSAGLDISRRKYNKRFRLLRRMEVKLSKLVRELRKYEYTRVGKTGLATRLSWEDFSRDASTACFISYYAARCNLRSEFTVAGQQRPFDEIAHMLFQRCQGSASTHWLAIAHVYPKTEVLAHLSDAERGALLGTWFELLQDIAELLREIFESASIARDTMIVRRGNDSTTWNNTASAWNKAREGWIAVLHAMGAEAMLDTMCPGKVLRLMAADVAAWHRYVGHHVDPDTHVWADLPLPWEVLSGERMLGRAYVEHVCRVYGVDPVKRGWTAPRPTGAVAKFRATPELVHGVAVASPALASVLRGAGWFSGKKAASVAGLADPILHGAVAGAHVIDKERELAEKERLAKEAKARGREADVDA